MIGSVDPSRHGKEYGVMASNTKGYGKSGGREQHRDSTRMTGRRSPLIQDASISNARPFHENRGPHFMAVHINSEDARGILGVKTAIAACKILRDAGVEAIAAGGSVRNKYEARAVVQVAFDRRRVALARHRNDPAAYAREIVTQLRPPAPESVTLIDGRKARRDGGPDLARLGAQRNKIDPLAALGPDAAMVFGPGVLKAAAADLKPGTCRFCVAHIETPWGGIGPDLSEGCRVLLGQPCLRCTVDLTPPKRPAARTASARPRTAQTSVSRSGLTPMVWWSSQAANARALAAQARRRGEQGEAAQLDQRATVYDTRARRGDPIG